MSTKQKICILGAGESGIGAAMLALKQGFEVFVSDSSEIKEKFRAEIELMAVEFEEKQHSVDRILKSDLIIKSPGIPEKAEIIKKIRAANIELISEVEFAWRFADGKTIAITGSNGKSTVTALTHHIFTKAGMDAALVGNIGVSYARQVANDPKEFYILEVSSFQLDDVINFKPDVAVLTNITPDHLDRYNYDMSQYAAAKFAITKNQDASDHFVYCTDDPETLKYMPDHEIKAHKIPFSSKCSDADGGWVCNEELTIHLKKKPLPCRLMN